MSRELEVNNSTSEDIQDIVNEDRVGKKTATTFSENELVGGDTANDVKGLGILISTIPKLEGVFSENEIPEYNSTTEKFRTSGKKVSDFQEKDTDAVEGNIAVFDNNGNGIDSGISKSRIEDAQFTGEIENTASVFDSGAFEIVDGPLKLEKYTGNTVVNIVDGEGVANLGTVPFDSILNNKYYDSLNDVILTGTGSNMTSTNNSGDVADMMIIPMTNMYYENYTTIQMKETFPVYIDGMQGTGHKKISSRDNLGVIKDSNYIPSLNKLPNGIADTWVNGLWTKNIQEYVLTEDDILSITTADNVDIVSIAKNIDYEYYGDGYNIDLNNSLSSSLGWVTTTYSDDATKANRVYSNTNTSFGLLTSKGIYTTLLEAKTSLAGTKIVYQLETAVTTIEKQSNMTAYEDGDFVVENKFTHIEYYGEGIDLASYGYSNLTIASAFLVTSDSNINGYQELNPGDFVVTGTVITNPNLNDTDLVFLEPEYADGRTQITTIYDYPMNLRGTISTTVEKVTENGKNIEYLNKEISRLQKENAPVVANLSINAPDALDITPGTPLSVSNIDVNFIRGFKYVSSSLVWDEDYDIYVKVDGAISCISDINNSIVTISFGNKGVIATSTEIDRKISTGADVGALPVAGGFVLTKGDYLDFFVDVNVASIITITKGNFTIHKLVSL